MRRATIDTGGVIERMCEEDAEATLWMRYDVASASDRHGVSKASLLMIRQRKRLLEISSLGWRLVIVSVDETSNFLFAPNETSAIYIYIYIYIITFTR